MNQFMLTATFIVAGRGRIKYNSGDEVRGIGLHPCQNGHSVRKTSSFWCWHSVPSKHRTTHRTTTTHRRSAKWFTSFLSLQSSNNQLLVFGKKDSSSARESLLTLTRIRPNSSMLTPVNVRERRNGRHLRHPAKLPGLQILTTWNWWYRATSCTTCPTHPPWYDQRSKRQIKGNAWRRYNCESRRPATLWLSPLIAIPRPTELFIDA